MSDYVWPYVQLLPAVSGTMWGVTAGGVGLALAITVYRCLNRPGPARRHPVHRLRQGIELDDGVYQSPLVTDPFSEECYLPDVHTLYEGFQRGLRISRNGKCLGKRGGAEGHYQWLTYAEVFDRVKDFGSGLLELGLCPRQGTFLGIYSLSRIEWTLTEQAVNAYSMVVVPLYDSLGRGATSFIINQAELETVVCDSENRAMSLVRNAKKTPSLKRLIMMDALSERLVVEGRAVGVDIKSFSYVEDLGRSHPREPVPPKPEDLATICYTSGTTGDPKGVMLSHFNIAANVDFITKFDFFGFRVTPDDVHMSYLPLPHMFERCMQFMMFTNGGQIGFYQGDIKRLTDDIAELKPTIFATVPRLLNRLYDKILSASKTNRFKSLIFNLALRAKLAEINRHIVRNDSLWDRLVFGKVQSILGGRLKCIITGSAPISPLVLNFLRCVFGCQVLEGYGQTETTAPIALHIPDDCDTDYIGGPTPCHYVKLTDVPDMGYFVSEKKGEICVKGPDVFSGYYKSPEKTAEVFDEEGWLLTGDIGQWRENGALKIIDRKKHIMKLSQGEYISPERIESVYTRCPFVGQIYVHGNSLKAYPVAIVVPDPEEIGSWAERQAIEASLEDLCLKKVVKETILSDMLSQGCSGGLLSYEQVRNIYLEPRAFSVENGLLTPTFKNKRPLLAKSYAEKLRELYDEAEA
ncbi:long-chain-fatty-acid--CoA ligase 5-like [Liolophura sinensis]|uniref:long-chain-fatty-acid--CoA ligase 5-like n=1 Tax=Liolophura sinensis TaxID=3198878 RepID=UPI0031591F87